MFAQVRLEKYKMEKLYLQNGYVIKSLTMDDIEITKALCLRCSDYYLLHDGILPSREKAEEIFTALPPDKSYEDKFVLGIFKNSNEIIGIIDIVKNFPDEGQWIIGLLIIDPGERGNGLGKRVHELLTEWAVKLGAKSFRIGAIEDNHKGIKFWSGLGYTKIKEVEMDFAAKSHTVNIMTVPISV
jgi:RimJ/RimL family protein N-acetyltransferase